MPTRYASKLATDAFSLVSVGAVDITGKSAVFSLDFGVKDVRAQWIRPGFILISECSQNV